MFFDGSARSTRSTTFPVRPAANSRAALRHLVGGGEGLERVGVDADGVVADRDAATVELDLVLVEVDLEAQELLAAREEVAHVPRGVEPHDVAPQQTPEDGVAHRRGQDAPRVGPGPRDVGEVLDEEVGAGRSQHSGHEIEVVIVDHHGAAEGNRRRVS